MAELVWDGKYRDGKKIAPVRVGLPFQTVETVNESAQDRQRTLDLFARGKPTEWRNRLIWGDKKYVLPSLLSEFAGKVDLIYIDPPFNTDSDFSFTTEIPESDESIEKQPSMIENKAYRDTWGRGIESYLQWFYDAVVLLRELLSPCGTLYVHLDYHVSHYAKCVLDEVFGADRYLSEIVWKRQSAHSSALRYGPIHDVIHVYTKSPEYRWNALYEPLSQEYIDAFFTNVDEQGRRFARGDLTGSGHRTYLEYEWRGYRPAKGRHWAVPEDKLEALHKAGKIFFPKDGMPRLKRYPEDSPGVPIQDVWTDIKIMHNQSTERVGYPTQKPEDLLKRIIKASSNEGDLVLDCFCGSGTTPTVAEKLGRRWIACDLGRFAIHTTRKRLLGIPGIKPFVVQNLGKYERQAWMAAEFETAADRSATEARYRAFILNLFGAQTWSGTWLHGVKGGRMVHVGAVDAPVTLADVQAITKEVWRAMGTTEGPKLAAVDVIGWEFAFELNETAKHLAAESRVEVRFRRIPRDVLDKRAVDQGDVQAKDFFELRALSAKLTKKKLAVALELTDFVLPAEDLPADVQKAIKHWSQWIDYWAVDWDFKNDTFHNEWQSYRSRAQPNLELMTSHTYKQPGAYKVVVKVIDILGNDTTKMIQVEVK